MGHAFGLPHSTWPGDYEGDVYDNYYDVMSKATSGLQNHPIFLELAAHPNAYHKDLLGWIPAAQKYDLPAGRTRTLTLERSAVPVTDDYRMIKIPVTGGRFYTVEARRKVGYDQKDAVIIHEVDPQRAPPEEQPSWLMGTDPGYGAQWTPGEIFDTGLVTVRVDSTTATGFVVTVSSDLKVLAVSSSGRGKVTGQGVACGAGTANDCSEAYAPGTVVSLTATPVVNTHQDWTFDHWEGACTGSYRTCIVTMSAARSVRAVFVE
jgi:hypothetical protein